MNKPRGKPFPPGNMAGHGRPKGSRNKATEPGQALLEEFAPHLIRRCIKSAMDGDRSSMRLCMDRVSPARRDAPVRINLPRIKTIQDLDKAAEKVTQAVGHGRLAPADGEKVMNIIEIRSRLIEKSEFEKRFEKLEQSVAASKIPRAA